MFSVSCHKYQISLRKWQKCIHINKVNCKNGIWSLSSLGSRVFLSLPKDFWFFSKCLFVGENHVVSLCIIFTLEFSHFHYIFQHEANTLFQDYTKKPNLLFLPHCRDWGISIPRLGSIQAQQWKDWILTTKPSANSLLLPFLSFLSL